MTASRSDAGKRIYFFTRIFTNFLNLPIMKKSISIKDILTLLFFALMVTMLFFEFKYKTIG